MNSRTYIKLIIVILVFIVAYSFSQSKFTRITADDDTQLGKLVKEFHIGKLVKPDSAPDLFEALVAYKLNLLLFLLRVF